MTLTTGKMSSRKGNVLTGESLFAEVAEAARERASESRADDVEKLANQLAVAAIRSRFSATVSDQILSLIKRRHYL